MSSEFEPTERSGDALLKFAEMVIEASQKPGKNGRAFWEFTFIFTPADMAYPIKKRIVRIFDPGYEHITTPSIKAQVQAGTITGFGDIFTKPGEPQKKVLVSYQTPKMFFVATKNDIDFAKQNGSIQDFQANDAGQLMKPNYPIKIVHIYNDRDQWAADAQAAPQPTVYQQAAPAPVQAAPVPDIERGVILEKLPFFVKSSGLNLGLLEEMLSKDPFKKYLTIDSPEVKLAFAQVAVEKFGTDTPELAEFLAGLNGYLAPDSQEVLSSSEEVPF